MRKIWVQTYEELKTKLWELGTSENGIFGIKHSHHPKITKEIMRLRGMEMEDPINHETVFADIFPNCKHIYLTRRNKIRQAISCWKAINDEVWHIEKGKQHQNKTSFY